MDLALNNVQWFMCHTIKLTNIYIYIYIYIGWFEKLTSWLSSVLQPVLEHFSHFCIKDSFSFSKIVRNFIPTDVFMCSFDVCSVYRSIPLEETIEICCDVLFRRSLSKPAFTESVYKHLMNFATSSVEFSFNNIMYRQIDGVAMGSSLGPTLANTFVGFCEANLFSKIDCPPHVLSLCWRHFLFI